MQKTDIILVIILLIVLWTIIEQKRLIVTKYIVASKKLPIEFDNTNFVVLSDLHNYKFGNHNERLVKKIESLSPDYIIIAGDMINKQNSCYPSNAFSLIEKLARKYTIYYAYGNHEQRLDKQLSKRHTKDKDSNVLKQIAIRETWFEFRRKLLDLGVIFLDNKSTKIHRKNEKVSITGLSIGREFFTRQNNPAMEEGYLADLVGEVRNEDYQILIAHNPVYFKEYAKWGADLTISGHLHGGLIRLPGVGGLISPQVKFFPKYNAGNFTEKGQQLVVSRGLGSHSMMPRVFNAPEIVLLKMKSEE